MIVEDHELFPEEYPDAFVVPLSRDERLAYPAFTERIDPTPDNGAESISWALAHHVTSVSLQRLTPTGSRVTSAQLVSIRWRIALAIGIG